MLHIHRSERADGLVVALGALLADPQPDPFAPELISVPTRGMERWLTQQLSAVLGARSGHRDGVCANIEFPFPRRLIGGAIATASGIDPDADPWPPGRSVWPLLQVVNGCIEEEWMAQLAAHLAGAGDGRRFGRVRLIADLYDHYGIRRPSMLQAWARGDDVDGAGRELPTTGRWQPELWRRLRDEIGSPSPAERLDTACERLRSEPEILKRPPRISLFGLTRLPASYVDVLSALAAGRDVHLFLLHPSPALWDAVATATAGATIVTREQDSTAALAANRLLGSWGTDSRELQLVLDGVGGHADHSYPAIGGADRLLSRLQADVRTNRPPPGIPLPDQPDARLLLAPDDASVAVHSCHGPARQVEVLREAIMHLLAEDPTLEPRDVIVMCPDIETFAPLIEATFGAVGAAHDDDPHGLPPGPRRADLRVRLADRSLRQTNTILGVVAQLIDLAEQRLTASQMLDLADSEPVRRRFRFDDDDISRIQNWVASSGIRWGLDAAHRVEYKLDQLAVGTWEVGLKRLLLGVAMSESGRDLYEGVLPVDDVESGEIDLAGRFAEFVERVGICLDSLREPDTPAGWVQAIATAADELTATGERDSWQRYELLRILNDVSTEAADAAETATITLPEARALLAHRLRGRPTRANFRTGHLTVCTLVPMRSVPHRVVCLLGLDDGAFPRRSPRDGDDLLLEAPHVGDRDPRAEDRQMLLDALLAAGDRLIVMYSGHDERTNAPRPPAVPVGELLDAIDRTARTSDGPARDLIVVDHPLQAFDPRNFSETAPWGFDETALEGARALSAQRLDPAPFLTGPLPALAAPTLALDELIQFVERPVRAFLRQRLGVSLGFAEDGLEDGLPVELDALDRWQIGQRLLEAALAGVDSRRAIRAEIARGVLPPSKLGIPVAKELANGRDLILGHVGPYLGSEPSSTGINIVLGGGRRLTGTVSGIRGETLLAVTFSRLNARHRLASWVRLLALGVCHPERAFEAVTIGRAPTRSHADVAVSRIGPLGESGGGAAGRELLGRAELERLVELRDRGLREALPLSALTSAAYARAVKLGGDPTAVAESLWNADFEQRGESTEPEHVLAFGAGVTYEELLTIPPAPDESDAGWETGEPSRFGRYARRLWDPLLAIETVIEQ
jgi:exodeoxyribonuclease V gamma subunit